jgi:hypothetical protein
VKVIYIPVQAMLHTSVFDVFYISGVRNFGIFHAHKDIPPYIFQGTRKLETYGNNIKTYLK